MAKTAGVAIDDWKLEIFKRHLDAAGYTYTVHPGLTPGTLFLKVPMEWAHQLAPIIKAASDEAAISKARKQ